MKYKAVYDVLNERRQTTPGFCYHDRSGWRAYPQTYMTMQCPLWIIAEDGQYAEWRHHRPTLREAYSALARLPHGHIPFHCQPAAAHPVAWRKPLPDFQFVSCSAPSFFINDRTPSRTPGHSHFVTLQQPMPETGCYPCFPSGQPSAHPPKAFLPNGRYE